MSVVICAYTTDRWAQIQEAVRSVLDQDHAAYEVLLVVDHCPSLLALAQETFAASEVRVIANVGPKGLSGARNTGTAAATGHVVVFLDDDAVAQPGWLAGHARHYQDPAVLGVGGRVLPAWESAAPGWFPVEFGWVVGCSYLGQPTVTAPVRNPIGANMSFRRPVIEAVGGFATSLGRVGTSPEGCEETEFSIRAAAAFPNSKILHEPGASVRHHVPAHRGTWTYFRRRCWAEGRSKARMSRLVSARSALASETAYVRRTLPEGVRRNLVAAGRRRDLTLVARATAICLGFAITSAGFTSGRLTAGIGTPGATARTGS
jgi:glucosyl-dolichyl phosphate glucuronosyltransferase